MIVGIELNQLIELSDLQTSEDARVKGKYGEP